jgi:hypothetical protein
MHIYMYIYIQVAQFLSNTYPAQGTVAMSAKKLHTVAQGLRELAGNFDLDSPTGVSLKRRPRGQEGQPVQTQSNSFASMQRICIPL